MSSPMMSQYWKIKTEYPDKIVFFRLGDFYEMFDQDAILVSNLLHITLTKRRNKIDGEIPMCGVPFHSAENYISKLIKLGYSVAICDQVEKANASKGIVKREIVKVITPGTVMIDAFLQEKANNFIISAFLVKSYVYFAIGDISTGELFVDKANINDFIDLISIYKIKEIIVYEKNFKNIIPQLKNIDIKLSFESKWSFDLDKSWELLCEYYKIKTLDVFGIKREDPKIMVLGALFNYFKYTQHTDLSHIQKPLSFLKSDTMKLDLNTINNLELIYPSKSGPKNKSLYDILNHTLNPMGERLLQKWILSPLLDKSKIEKRQTDIIWFQNNADKLSLFQNELKKTPDLERIIAKISSLNSGPRDLGIIKDFLQNSSNFIDIIPDKYKSSFISFREKTLDLKEKLESALQDNLPLLARDGGFIKKGFRSDIDDLIELSRGGKNWLIKTQEKEKLETGINNLKIGFNKVFGYYIEISKSNLDKVPNHYIKKQTLANGERFITEEIKAFEEKILVSEEKLLQVELEVFQELTSYTLEFIPSLQKIAKYIAYLDIIQGFSKLGIENKYVLPTITDDQTLEIKDGRHPVIENLLDGEYISNDTLLNNTDHSFMLITGPNMAGKSTYSRQVALIVLMAQIGCFVPASKAKIGIVDRIFTRIGASDNLSEGQSTFMVEMIEVAQILNFATDKSLIILDEVGRGTSTFDGMSIAKAISEYIHNKIGAKTIFATHYHELLELENLCQGIVNYKVLVEENKNEILFLRKIEKGGIDKSFGIAIAKLAGFPDEIIQNANNILLNYEAKKSKFQPSLLEKPQVINNTPDPKLSILSEKIKNLDLNNITPLQAINWISDLKKIV